MLRHKLNAGVAGFWFCLSAAGYTLFEWPDPRRNSIVLVNANQDIASYLGHHPDWFRPGETVLDLSVPNRADTDAAERERTEIQALLSAKGMMAGTYTSGTTVEPQARIHFWPYAEVPVEWMPKSFAAAGSWPGDALRTIIDVSNRPARRALQAGIRRIWQGSPAAIRFVDNAASHQSTGGTQPWPAYCANMREIREIGESMGCRLVFNVSAHLALLSDSEAEELMRTVGKHNGILLEDPWGEATRQSPELTRRAQSRYRQLLDDGLTIIVLPVSVSVDALTGWLHTWRKPSDCLYLGWPFWKEPLEAQR